MVIVEGSAVDPKAKVRGFLKLGRTIAWQAYSLPPDERRAFVRREVNDLRQMYEPIYKAKASSPGRALLESMEGWVARLVEILDQEPDRDQPIS
jgi:hypothetical protein